MKLPAFDYMRAESVSQVFDALKRHEDDACILAGGQSLIAALNFRLSEPALLIDINRLAGWDEIEETADAIRIGALVRHCQVLNSATIRAHLPMISQAMAHVAHPAIRNRGTFGGSVALADPAAEMPACCIAGNASIIVIGPGGEKKIPAHDFFQGLYQTALAPDELIRAVEFPKANAGLAWHYFDEITRRQGDYAMTGLAAFSADVNKPGAIRLVWFGLSDRPVRAAAAEAVFLSGQSPGTAKEWSDTATAGLSVFGDTNASEPMKKHLASVLLNRASQALKQRSLA